MYREKVEAVIAMFLHVDDRLHKTGQAEIFLKLYQDKIIDDLRRFYYTGPGQPAYPVILDAQGRVIMHPDLPRGDHSLLEEQKLHLLLSLKEGSLEYLYHGVPRWIPI